MKFALAFGSTCDHDFRMSPDRNARVEQGENAKLPADRRACGVWHLPAWGVAGACEADLRSRFSDVPRPKRES